ncbi:hypothetical protein L1N85_20560 [Paenibacillus alkaliterrae]|uniref:hypothetical protein n=1 Tax=Paenibacillus alkaliterrae TaxID=320909 RepID=UPI001F429565|nr:hypothetical protein [Paenibacillus alkaliterrae]MCF2940787.1 hypothetical protein [Paenibacillus alkaliterrae]
MRSSFGHEQSVFPGDKDYDGVEGLDNKAGLIHGVPSVMAGFAGDHLGVIDLKLTHNNGKWKVVDGSSKNIPVEETTEAAPELVEAIKMRLRMRLIIKLLSPIIFARTMFIFIMKRKRLKWY